MRTRVKICGITRKIDADMCVKAGADAIGLVFYQPSPRAIATPVAREIVDNLSAFVTTVGLFVNAEKDEVAEVLRTVKLDCLQFHGNEDVAYCEQFDRPYIKAIRMTDNIDVDSMANEYASARALLLDTYVTDVPGGTGQAFNWERVPENCSQPIILAGGLTPDNIQDAIKVAKPYAVDVSGGVELSKGIKDAGKVAKFINEVGCFDSSN
jgi:phosphoribosylanthranilate isomerase